jgi:hypothetical protein
VPEVKLVEEDWGIMGETMKTKVGLWIDHEQAIIEALTSAGEAMLTIKSKVEKQPGRYGGIRSITPYETQQKSADDSLQRRYTGQLNIFYDAVIASVREATEILIFGPSEAKGELKRRLVRNGLGGRVVGVETTGKMTDRQVAAKVKKHFQENKTPGPAKSAK